MREYRVDLDGTGAPGDRDIGVRRRPSAVETALCVDITLGRRRYVQPGQQRKKRREQFHGGQLVSIRRLEEGLREYG